MKRILFSTQPAHTVPAGPPRRCATRDSKDDSSSPSVPRCIAFSLFLFDLSPLFLSWSGTRIEGIFRSCAPPRSRRGRRPLLAQRERGSQKRGTKHPHRPDHSSCSTSTRLFISPRGSTSETRAARHPRPCRSSGATGCPFQPYIHHATMPRCQWPLCLHAHTPESGTALGSQKQG